MYFENLARNNGEHDLETGPSAKEVIVFVAVWRFRNPAGSNFNGRAKTLELGDFQEPT